MEAARPLRLMALSPDKRASVQQIQEDRSNQAAIHSTGALQRVDSAKQVEVGRPRKPNMTRSSKTCHEMPILPDRRRAIQRRFPAEVVVVSDRASDDLT